MNKLLFICLSFLLYASMATAQITIGNTDGNPGTLIQVPVYIQPFTDLTGVQFRLTWDDAVIQLESTSYHPATTAGGSNPSIGSNKTYIWIDNNLSPQSIPTGDPLMTMTFRIIGMVGDDNTVSIDLTEDIEFIDDTFGNKYNPIDYPLIAGSTTVVPPITGGGGDYGISIDTTLCNDLDVSTGQARICMPLVANVPVTNGIIGMDYCLDYDETLMSPTGIVQLGNVVLDGSLNADYFTNYITSPGQIHVSIFYNAQAPANAEFIGTGEVACVEFVLNSTVTTGTTANFALCNGFVEESYLLGAAEIAADPGSWTLEDDNILEGTLVFWDDSSRPLRFDAANPTDYLVTNVSGTDLNCGNVVAATTPDLNGNFEYDITNGAFVALERDIAGGSTGGACPTDVMPFINGQDVYFTSLVTTYNSSYVPSPYGLIAMDVNMDDKVTSGDITQIQNRIVQNFCEYQQVWNYPAPTEPSLDWRIIDQYTRENAADFELSSAFPNGDNSGYFRNNVPDVPRCLEVRTQSLSGVCNYIDAMTYEAILLGDANGTWNGNTAPTNVKVGSTDNGLFGICPTPHAGVHRIPVSFESTDPFFSLDFTMDYDEQILKFVRIEHAAFSNAEIGMAYNDQNEERLMFTSYSKVAGGLMSSTPLFYIVFESINTTIAETDLGTPSLLLNGNTVPSEIYVDYQYCVTGINETTLAGTIKVFPNLVSNSVNIDLADYKSEVEVIALYDVHGRQIERITTPTDSFIQLDMSHLPVGVYFLRINEFSEKLVKQ